jgi:hypothetical protein
VVVGLALAKLIAADNTDWNRMEQTASLTDRKIALG